MAVSTLTPEEMELAAEKALIEEREKEKRRAIATFLQYRYEQIKEKINKERQKELYDAILRGLNLKQKLELPKILPAYLFAFGVGEKAIEKRNDFFKVDFSKPENEELKEDLKTVDMTEDQFATLAFFACGKDIEKFVDKFNEEAEDELILETGGKKISGISKPGIDYDKLRDEGILKARAAISEFRHGDPKAYAKILGTALLLACTSFAREPSDDVAMQWSLYSDEIIKLFAAKKELVKHCGLDRKHFEIADKVAMMGRTINGGLKAAEKINQIRFNEKGDLEDPGQIAEINTTVAKFTNISRIREGIADEIFALVSAPEKKANAPVLG